MADSIWYLVGHFEGGINRGLQRMPIAWAWPPHGLGPFVAPPRAMCEAPTSPKVMGVGHWLSIAYAWLDAFGDLDAYCLRMHTASECIQRQYAFGGSMHSEAVCIQAIGNRQ